MASCQIIRQFIFFLLYMFPDVSLNNPLYHGEKVDITINSWIFDRKIDVYIIDGVEGHNLYVLALNGR